MHQADPGHARIPSPLFLAPLLCLAAPALSDGVSVVLHGAHVEQVTAGATVLPASDLAAGRSVGAVDFVPLGGMGIGAADGRSLATYFARSTASPDWIVDLESWQDANGDGYDFFLFEVGGNDAVQVAPVFPNGSFGKDAPVAGWTSTGYQPSAGPNSGQTVYGLAFKRSQLLDASGTPLAPSATIQGVRIRSASIDGAAFLAHRPNRDVGQDGDGSVTVTGTTRVGQLVELVYRGPWASETDVAPNPFLDYRLTVTFNGPGGRVVVVPGFFDADGSGGEWGTLWKARLRAPERGSWTASASFRQGPGVAVSLSPNAGTPGLLDGVATTFEVAPRDLAAPGFLKYGHLQYVGTHYRRFEHGSYFVKAGCNSPENLLAFRGFDGVSKYQGSVGNLHTFAPHAGDWRPGDPLFVGRDHGVSSKGLIGAMNYLASVGINALHVMPMNLGGDGQDAFPFLAPDPTAFAKTHYDTSRLDQWNQVFEHAARLGMALQVSLAETETQNENWLDNGGLGTERKLFFREMAARFAHHPAILWTLSEENDYPVSLLRAFADYLQAVDPYGHPITIHNHPNDFSDYDQIKGDPRFSATALQFSPDQAEAQVEEMRADSAAAGHPWVVGAVEHTPYSQGVTDTNHDEMRKRILYDVLFSGGHLEWYLGWHGLPLGGDLSVEDFRTRHEMWEDNGHALALMRTLPFWQMSPADHLLSGEDFTHGGGEVFAKPGSIYAIYLPRATSTGTLDLTGAGGDFVLRWFDPREGVAAGSSIPVTGGGSVALGPPPYASSEDWVALIVRPNTLTGDVAGISVSAGGEQKLTLAAKPGDAGRPYVLMGSMTGTSPGFLIGNLLVPLNFDRYTRWTVEAANGPVLQNTRGLVPPSGTVQMKVVLGPGDFAPLVGTTLYHAAVLREPTDFASNAVALELLP